MRVVEWQHQAESPRVWVNFEVMRKVRSLAEREEDPEHDSDDDEREDREREETPTGPLDFCAAHRRDELLALQLREPVVQPLAPKIPIPSLRIRLPLPLARLSAPQRHARRA